MENNEKQKIDMALGGHLEHNGCAPGMENNEKQKIDMALGGHLEHNGCALGMENNEKQQMDEALGGLLGHVGRVLGEENNEKQQIDMALGGLLEHNGCALGTENNEKQKENVPVIIIINNHKTPGGHQGHVGRALGEEKNEKQQTGVPDTNLPNARINTDAGSGGPPSIDVEDATAPNEEITDLTAAAAADPPRRPPPTSAKPPSKISAKKKKKIARKKKKKTPTDYTAVPDLDPEALGAADFISSSLLAFPAPQKILDDDTRARAVTAISLFNGVVWFERSYYFKMMSAPPTMEEATNWLASTAALDHISAFDLKQVRGLGRAGTRTPAQVKAAHAYGQRLLDSIEPRSITAFTDGASKGNPGPCGAGAYVYDNLASPWDQEDSAALGHGTNNLGELWAIGMAMQIAARRVSTHLQHYDQFRIFSDSQYSIGILTQGWKSRAHPKLAFKLRHLFNNFPIPIHIDRVGPCSRWNRLQRARGRARGQRRQEKR